MVDYSMSNRTYRYFQGEPAYPFGYGLSYTDFSYSGLRYDAFINNASQHVYVQVEVTNTGSFGSDEVMEKGEVEDFAKTLTFYSTCQFWALPVQQQING